MEIMKGCIKCKKSKELSSFKGGNKMSWLKFCADCWRKNTNDELDWYESHFLYDYFCQKYADALENNPYYKKASEIDYSGFIVEQEKKLAEEQILKERRKKRNLSAKILERTNKEIELLEKQLEELRADQQRVFSARQGGGN